MAPEAPRGFDGLSRFATDVDAAIAAADGVASRPVAVTNRSTSATSANATGPVDRDAGWLGAGAKKVGGWVLGIGLLIAVKACVFGGIHAVTSPGSGSSYASGQADGPPPTPAQGSDATAGGMTAADGAASGSTTAPDASAPDATIDDGNAMSRPASGVATLTMPELRYCIAEDIRIGAEKGEMDELHLSDVDRFNRNVDGFNQSVTDYNAACVNRMYNSSQKPLATSQVEARRTELEGEGRGRVD